MIEHSISYIRDRMEQIAKSGQKVRITRHGITVGMYYPIKRLVGDSWEDIPREPRHEQNRPSPLEEQEIAVDSL